MKRILLITLGVLLGLCILCVGLGYFVGLPRFKEGVEDSVDEAFATYVAPEIVGIGATPMAGTYTLNEADVNDRIAEGNPDLSDLRLEITPVGIELRFGEQGQDVAYTANVSAVDGRIEVSNAEISGVPEFILPVEAISNGVERGINSYLGQYGLVVASVTMQDGSMTLVLEDG